MSALIVLIALLFFSTVEVKAQSVTIRPSTGATIAAIKDGGVIDTFFKFGGYATWRHEQLNLTMTVSDNKDLTDNGLLANPANNLLPLEDEDVILIGKGQVEGANVNYITISLPSGYRFTGYEIVFSKDKNRFGTENFSIDGETTFGETNSSFNFVGTNNATVSYNTSISARKKIARSSYSESDMGNILYFKMEGPSDKRAIITLHSVQLYFTAETDYSPITPATAIGTPVSAVDIPFPTSYVDYGEIGPNNYQGVTRFSYYSSNIKDLPGNLVLFEKESVVDGTNYDGRSGKVVDYKSGTISSVGSYFKLGRTDREQIYYIETPTYIELPNTEKTKVPIGYRIVSAKFDYTKQLSTNRKIQIKFRNLFDDYYLNTSGKYTTTPVTWEIDEEGYISSNGNYLVYGDDGRISTQPAKPTDRKYTFELNGEYVRRKTDSSYYIRVRDRFNSSRYGAVTNNNSHTTAVYNDFGTTPINTGDFVFKVYDKSGENPQIITVNNSNSEGSIEINGLNNDAVKIGVEGIGLIMGTLTLQYLDPYIDNLSIVCQESEGNGRRLSQQFTASDFSVRGGKFVYYVPEDFSAPCKFTFERLYSSYGDNTYWNANNNPELHSRYSFVMSDYWNNNKDLYSTTYDPDFGYENKVITTKAGTEKFIFNNASQLSSSSGYLIEYPFNLTKYDENNFHEVKMDDGDFTTNYLFTCDETRYNISPATATEHRSYAFYEMIIELHKKSYSPVYELVKVYDTGETLFIGSDGQQCTDAQYGIKLKTTESGGESGEYGYLTVNQILNLIDKAVSDHAEGINNASQILYVDGSNLLSVVEEKDVANGGIDAIRNELGVNSLVYLPHASTTHYDNYAYKTEGGLFHGAANFVLQDQKPFYAPYDIQIDAANTCTYTRNVTIDKNGKVARASIILPFEISLDGNGNHVNKDGTIPFSVHQMKSEECLSSTPVDGEENLSYVLFPSVTNVTKTEANTPYLIRVKKESYNSGDDKIIFVATQSGSLIKATTGMDNTEKYSFKGGESFGTFNGKNFRFTAYGSYAGKKLHIGHHYYYYSRDRFVCSDELDSWREYAKLTPFRTYYKGNGPLVGLLPAFGVIFGDGEGETDPTGIVNADEVPDLVISTETGMLTMASSISQEVDIRNLNGVLVNRISIGAGDTLSVTLPAGIYIVNGTKLIVK